VNVVTIGYWSRRCWLDDNICCWCIAGESSRRQIHTWTAARQFPALGQLAASVSTARIFQMAINSISTSDEQHTATADGTSTVGQVIKCKGTKSSSLSPYLSLSPAP